MKQEDIEFFNRMAPGWDKAEVNSVPAKINLILDYALIEKGQHVLDLGTGTGVLVPYLLERVGKDGKVTAVDASEGMLEQAKLKYGTTACRFLRADFEAESLEGRYDRIMLYCVYPHLEHPAQTLKRLVDDNLREDGSIVIAFPTTEDFVNRIHGEKKIESEMLPPARELARRLRAEGLEATAEDCGPNVYMVKIRNSNRG